MLSAPSQQSDIEFIFLGTGTSNSIPQIDCLTTPSDSNRPPCRTCVSTLKPEGRKNARRNTSAAVRMQARDGRSVTIVIDTGKNFQAAALEWFPKYKLRKIDAVLLTHAHADAINGLDDLRGWTLRGAIQPHIDIYASDHTFREVQRAFPYLVSKEFASGGGDVPEFKWHIIRDREPFEIEDTGISITPFAVHHGRIFSVAPPPTYVVTPSNTLPSTPVRAGIALPTKPPTNGFETPDLDSEEKIYPYLSFGFKIQERIVYISDVSHVPEDVFPALRPQGDNAVRSSPTVAIVDCLRLRPHLSHMGLEGALGLARRINATRTYMTGFGHEVAHEEYVKLGEILSGAEYVEEELSEKERDGLRLLGEERGLWLRPAFDGLRLVVGPDGEVEERCY